MRDAFGLQAIAKPERQRRSRDSGRPLLYPWSTFEPAMTARHAQPDGSARAACQSMQRNWYRFLVIFHALMSCRSE
jgi:hypothetical protein